MWVSDEVKVPDNFGKQDSHLCKEESKGGKRKKKQFTLVNLS